MRTGEKRIHYLKIIRQLSTYRKKEMSQKGREKSLRHLFSCHFATVRICDDVLICALGKRCPAVARAHSL